MIPSLSVQSGSVPPISSVQTLDTDRSKDAQHCQKRISEDIVQMDVIFPTRSGHESLMLRHLQLRAPHQHKSSPSLSLPLCTSASGGRVCRLFVFLITNINGLDKEYGDELIHKKSEAIDVHAGDETLSAEHVSRKTKRRRWCCDRTFVTSSRRTSLKWSPRRPRNGCSVSVMS